MSSQHVHGFEQGDSNLSATRTRYENRIFTGLSKDR